MLIRMDSLAGSTTLSFERTKRDTRFMQPDAVAAV